MIGSLFLFLLIAIVIVVVLAVCRIVVNKIELEPDVKQIAWLIIGLLALLALLCAAAYAFHIPIPGLW